MNLRLPELLHQPNNLFYLFLLFILGFALQRLRHTTIEMLSEYLALDPYTPRYRNVSGSGYPHNTSFLQSFAGYRRPGLRFSSKTAIALRALLAASYLHLPFYIEYTIPPHPMSSSFLKNTFRFPGVFHKKPFRNVAFGTHETTITNPRRAGSLLT